MSSLNEEADERARRDEVARLNAREARESVPQPIEIGDDDDDDDDDNPPFSDSMSIVTTFFPASRI